MKPSWPAFLMTSSGKICSSSHSSTCGPISASANSRTDLRRWTWSGVYEKSIAGQSRSVCAIGFITGLVSSVYQEGLACSLHRVAMNPHRVFDIARVSARERDGQRHITRAAQVEHQPVPPHQALDREGEAAELVVEVGVGARDVHDQA